MCGIAGFVLGDLSRQTADVAWLTRLGDTVASLPPGAQAAPVLAEVVSGLHAGFGALMALATHRALAAEPALRSRVEALADALGAHEAALVALSEQGRTDLDPVVEGLRDFSWQLREELIGHVDRVAALAPARAGDAALGVAFAVEHVLAAIDRLEVRGRDSAGVVVQLTLPRFDAQDLPPALADELASRRADLHAGHRAVSVLETPRGGAVVGVVYKTANLIGRLGDNGAALRAAIRADALFWSLAAAATQVDVLAHTRWASSGIISVANCHPHNASLTADGPDAKGLGAMFVLNGDVDNHHELQQELLAGFQRAVDPSITTDTKIIPIACRFTGAGEGGLDRFRAALRRLDGSMAIAALDPARPGEAVVAQKGSGQGLHAARLAEGWIFASELYGLANVTRSAFNLARTVQGGVVARLGADAAEPEVRATADGSTIAVSQDAIQIFARDIYRGRFDYFLEKEIHDAPDSVAKTLRGRYRHVEGAVRFDGLPADIWANLRTRARGGLRRVIVIGQGTAGVAGVGIAHLIERALARDPRRAIPVCALRSSELSSEIDGYDLRDALVVAVSQSGTTTDTNRAVDLARERGAFVHAIVNRRNSDLVRKSDSVLYTSDGRDVEMSVASTKAFYSQLTAGKLTALFLADVLGAMAEVEVAREIADLERLPEKIRAVLATEEVIAEAARTFAPRARYWAVTGSGVNHVAALEIRIKLSELCYKSIPVDYTEDKKHIDLSTEPLTLVIANDLPPGIAGDTVKEVAIFRAHNGRPIVFATAGPDADAFAANAERVIPLPRIGSELGFVLATVAGHLFGFHAARAIDAGAQQLKQTLTDLGHAAETGDLADAQTALAGLEAFVDDAATGAFDSGLGGRDVATLAALARRLGDAVARVDAAAAVAVAVEGVPLLRRAFEETSRPVDTIRHQAKTVTVGTSRPDDALTPAVRDALAGIGLAESRLSADDRKTLSAVSRLVDEVVWAEELTLRIDGRAAVATRTWTAGEAPLGRYADGATPVGVLGATLDERRVQVGRMRDAPVIVAPVQGDNPSEIAGLVCLCVRPLPHASREHKLGALRALGLYKPALRRWEDEVVDDPEASLTDEIARLSPETLLFEPEALAPGARPAMAKSA